MKCKFLIIFFSFFFFACKENKSQNKDEKVIISNRVNYKIEEDFFILKSGKFTNKISVSKLPFKSVMLLNSSFVGYFLELGLENTISGISNPEYVFSQKIKTRISENKIQNIGNEQKYDIEKILINKPDVIFTNYVPNFENTYNIIKKNNIELIFLDEYLEQNPLDKSKYLLLFGMLFGKQKEAEIVYNDIEKNYIQIKNKALEIKEKPEVLVNEMYGNQWFLPGGNAFISKIINDAGGAYILKENVESKAIPLSFEEVFVKSKSAKFWINISPHKNKQELLNINSNYSKLDVFKNGKLFMINNQDSGFANDYFESGVVRCDWVLQDYFKVFHPNHPSTKNHKLKYLKELK